MAKKKTENTEEITGINIADNLEKEKPLEDSAKKEDVKKDEEKKDTNPDYLYFQNRKNFLILNIKDDEEQKFRGFYINKGNFALTKKQYELCLEKKMLNSNTDVIKLENKPEKFQKPPKYIVPNVKSKPKVKKQVTRIEKKLI